MKYWVLAILLVPTAAMARGGYHGYCGYDCKHLGEYIVLGLIVIGAVLYGLFYALALVLNFKELVSRGDYSSLGKLALKAGIGIGIAALILSFGGNFAIGGAIIIAVFIGMTLLR